MNAFDNLILQIDSFIRKYYKNLILKGILLFFGITLFTFLFVTTLEYFGRFSSFVRGFFFFSFILLTSYVFLLYFLNPILKLFSFGKRIDRFQAASIIGKFFPEISDRLINTLQLNDSIDKNNVNFELIRASVFQRSNTLNVFNFSNGINLKDNYKYLKIVIPILFVFISIVLFYPSLITQGTNRVVNYTKEFVPEAPFNFNLSNSSFDILEGEDLPIELTLSGNEFPDKIYLVSNKGKFLMNKKTKIYSFFILKNLKNSTNFYFEANGFKSQNYYINVIPKSTIGKFQATLNFPTYLGKKDEIIANAGDLLLPEGTKVTWSVSTKNTSKSVFVFKDTSNIYINQGFNLSKRFFTTQDLKVFLYNNNSIKNDSLFYSIDVIKDEFPVIEVVEQKDSFSDALRFFEGTISDDYGLNSLIFIYDIIKNDGSKTSYKIPVLTPSGINQPFRFAYDFRRDNLKVDDRIEYYFIVKDNDGVNGNKTSKSKTFVYELPSLVELNDKRDEANALSQVKLQDLLKKSKEFKKNVEKLKKDITNSKSSDWKQNNQIQQLKDERNSLENELEKLQLMMNESLNEKNQLSEMDKELMEKQDLIQKLLEELMDDELKDLLNKLEELMNKQDKNQLQNNLEKLDNKSENMNKQLDRSLEMLKKMQVNEKIDDAIKELNDLKKEQDKLADDLNKKNISTEKAADKQEEINKKFEDIKKDLEELNKLNDDLKKPLDLNDTKNIENELSDELKNAKENLNSKKDSKAKQNQKQSSEKMDELAQELEKSQKEANKKQDEEDIDLLRNILESLMTLSFTQEDVLTNFNKVKDKDPFYKKLGKQQRKIIDDTKIVEDSLNAIASRQPKIASFINKELNDINTNFDFALENIDEHRKRDLLSNLQFVMTSYNNLALMLNESLQQMQQQMQQEMEGSGSCDKPGGKGKKPKEGDSDGMKETLKKQLEQMQKGPNPGGNKPGDKEGQGMMGLGNKEIAKMAAQQTAIRQKLEQLRNEMNKEGKGNGNKLNPLIDQLERQEKDLINQKFSKEMITRQKDILTRLLESEKALLERGFEEKREAKSGKNVFLSNQKRIDEYNNQKLKQIELLRSVDPVFKKYYKDKASDYFNFVN